MRLRTLFIILASLLIGAWFGFYFSGSFPFYSGEDGPQLQAGPMNGASSQQESCFWLQTTSPARVEIRYWPEADSASVRSTPPVFTKTETACAAKLVATRVSPGLRYGYEVLINGSPVSRPYPLRFQTPPVWKYRTSPLDFTLAAGSCAYVNEEPFDRSGKPYGADYQIFQNIAALKPDLMLWMGDNIYLREGDWNSRNGILHRYTHTRSILELQPLLASAQHYAAWDDHEAGPNDSNGSFWNTPVATEAFELFWPNPGFGMPGRRGITTYFEWNDAEFYLLDNRTFRSALLANPQSRTCFGREQIDWLINSLKLTGPKIAAGPDGKPLLRQHEPSFRFVVGGSQFLSTSGLQKDSFINFPSERDYLLRRLREEDIKGVVFLSGDVHYSELSRLERPGTYPLHDLTLSPLTAGPSANVAMNNGLRVPGCLVQGRNFGLLRFSGPADDRVLSIEIRDSHGKLLNAKPGSETEPGEAWVLHANDLQK